MPPRLTRSTRDWIGESKIKNLSSVRKRWNQKYNIKNVIAYAVKRGTDLNLTKQYKIRFFYIKFLVPALSHTGKVFDFAFPNPTPGAAC